MEFDSLLVSIQSFLSSLSKQHKSFVDIIHRGGNEEVLANICDTLKSLLHHGYFHPEEKPNIAFDDQFRKVTFYLILNTQFKGEAKFQSLEEFSSIVNTCPKLSTFVLANTVFGLGLAKWYSEVIYNLPVNISLELLEAAVPCIKKLAPDDALEMSALLVFSGYMKVYTLDDAKSEDASSPEHINGFLKAIVEVMKNFVTPDGKQMIDWPKKRLFRYLGRGFICLFKLIANCMKLFFELIKPLASHDFYISAASDLVSMNSPVVRKGGRIEIALQQMNTCLFSAGIAHLETVTLDIFIHWAEIDYGNNKTMQYCANANAYEVLNLVSNHKPAEQLSHILRTMVFKPKSVEQEIEEADDETLVKHSLIADENQRRWIRAFVNSGCYKRNSAHMEHLMRLLQLMDVEDVLCLLQQVSHEINCAKAQYKNAFLQCVQTFSSSDDIERLSIAYLEKCGFNVADADSSTVENVQRFFNKSESYQNPELVINLLHNPWRFMQILFAECLKALKRFSEIRCVFETLKSVLRVEEYEVNLFRKAFLSFFGSRLPANEEEAKCYVGLLEIGFQMDFLTCDTFLSEAVNPLLNKYKGNDAQVADLCYVLWIVNHIWDYIDINKTSLDVVCSVGRLLDRTRSAFVDFNSREHEIADFCAKIIENFVDKLKGAPEFETLSTLIPQQFEGFKRTTKFYYRNVWILPQSNVSFLLFVVPDLNANDEQDLSRILVNLLPRCLPREWILIAETLKSLHGNNDSLNVLVKVVTFLCTLCSQDEPRTVQGLRYCLLQFGVVANTQILPDVKSVQDKESFAYSMLGLLKKIPASLQAGEGAMLLSLFPRELLKQLSEDAEFVQQMISCSHMYTCKVLAKKMLKECES